MLRSSQRKSLFLGITLLLFWLLTVIEVNPESSSFSTVESVPEASVAGQINEETDNLYLVTEIVDGDTFKVLINEKEHTVRLIGIDTPELSNFGRPEMCYAKEATEKLSREILDKQVRLEKDVSETDRYGRLLRYVYVDDTFVNQRLVEEGFARAATFPPDVAFSEILIEKEQQARENKLGLWSDTCL